MKHYIVLVSGIILSLGFGYTADVVGETVFPKISMFFSILSIFTVIASAIEILDKK